MKSTKPGDRVGAILSATQDEVRLLGYGVYDGDFVPDSGILHKSGISNPRITLDDGRVVWGYQCWWGSEFLIKKSIGDSKVVHAEIPGERI